MTDFFSNSQKQNNNAHSDLPDKNSSSNAENAHPANYDNDLSASDTPLPNFAPESASIDTNLIKSSQADPPDLDEFLSTRRPNTAIGPDNVSSSSLETGPTYKISSATPDLTTYTLPPPEDSLPDEGQEEGSGWKTTWAVVREVGETILLTLIIFLLIQTVVRNFRVVGTSMVDNLQDGQYLIIDKLSYNPYVSEYLGIGGPHRGDVIVFEPPRRPDEDYVKRIIALPGETVRVVKGQVYIDDEPLDEPFVPKQASYTMSEKVTVPEGQVFVLGDNRNNSNDSHNWGPLPIENIVGRAWLSYWPPELWGTIPRDAPSQETTLKYVFGDLIPNANAQNE